MAFRDVLAATSVMVSAKQPRVKPVLRVVPVQSTLLPKSLRTAPLIENGRAGTVAGISSTELDGLFGRRRLAAGIPILSRRGDAPGGTGVDRPAPHKAYR